MKKLLLALAAVATFVVGSVFAKEHCGSCKPLCENRCETFVEPEPKCTYTVEMQKPACKEVLTTKNVSWKCPVGTTATGVKNNGSKAVEEPAREKRTHRSTRYNRGS